MGEKKLTFFILILLTSSLVLFQNCGVNKFVAGGNGDPHEGFGSEDPVVGLLPDDDSNEKPPIAQIGTPASDPNTPRWTCNTNSQDIDSLQFSVLNNAPTLWVAAVNGDFYRFFWDKDSPKAFHEIYKPISDSILLESIFFDQTDGKAIVNYFKNNKQKSLTIICSK